MSPDSGFHFNQEKQLSWNLKEISKFKLKSNLEEGPDNRILSLNFIDNQFIKAVAIT